MFQPLQPPQPWPIHRAVKPHASRPSNIRDASPHPICVCPSFESREVSSACLLPLTTTATRKFPRTHGSMLALKYKNGEKKVVVPSDVPIVGRSPRITRVCRSRINCTCRNPGQRRRTAEESGCANHAALQTRVTCPFDLLQCDLWLCLEFYIFGQQNCDLAIVLLAELPAILPCDGLRAGRQERAEARRKHFHRRRNEAARRHAKSAAHRCRPGHRAADVMTIRRRASGTPSWANR
jgi:hypothetical protein